MSVSSENHLSGPSPPICDTYFRPSGRRQQGAGSLTASLVGGRLALPALAARRVDPPWRHERPATTPPPPGSAPETVRGGLWPKAFRASWPVAPHASGRRSASAGSQDPPLAETDAVPR